MEGPIRVLYVDEEPGSTDPAATLEREEERFAVETATDANEGLDRLDDDTDCVVSGYDLSGRDGLAFLETVRERYPDLPCILFTGEGSEAVASEAVSAGVTDYLQRGSETDQYAALASRIRDAVEHSSTSPGSQPPEDGEHRESGMATEDVTEQRGREHTPETTRRQFEAVFHNPVAFMALLDTDGTVIKVNETAQEFVDCSADEVRGVPFPETPWWTHSESLQDDLRSWIERAADGEVVRFEGDHYAPDGERVTIDGVLHPIRDEDGSVVSLLAAGRDISARKERERELERTQALLNEVGEATFVWEPETGAFQRVNDAACDLLGYDREELLEMSVLDVNPAFDGIDEWRDHVDRLRSEDQVYFEGELVRSDGTAVPVEITTGIAPVEGGEYGVGVVRDVTHRKERERELERQNERLEEFAGVVSHDLRNPLNVAQGKLELAREECDSDHLDAVARAHRRMQTLIDDLLTLAREGGEVDEVEPADLAAVVERCWEAVDAPDAALAVEADRTVRADESRLHQLLANLIRNAVEHGGEDVTVTVGTLDDCRGVDGFYVEDDGPGIPDEDREDVFEAGYSTSEGGTGFGLSIVAEVAEAHGWDVCVTDGSGGGARFEVTGVEFLA